MTLEETYAEAMDEQAKAKDLDHGVRFTEGYLESEAFFLWLK